MYGLKKVIPVFAAAAALVAALPVAVQAQGPTWTSSKIEKYNGYDYELWNQDNKGTVSMKLTGDNGSSVGGTFEATWSSTTNVLFRSGRKFTNTSGQSVDGGGAGKTAAALGNITIDFAATWSSSDNVKMLGVYGWAFFASGSTPSNFSNQIEYYIIQDRGSYNSATSGTNSSKKGSATIDGIVYDFYVCDRMGQPMLTGNGNFKQYFSVPQNTSSHRTSGKITVSKHFEEWVKAGMKMDGPLYEVAMKVESYSGNNSSSGQAKVTKNILTIGGTGTSGFTLTTTISPANAGTVTRSPNSDSYASGTSVTLTAAAKSGYKFDSWSGGASGSTSPVSVTMNADKSVTARFTMTADDTTNLIKDGKFPGSSLTSNWELKQGQYYGNSEASASVSGGKATINVTKKGSDPWEPQLVQTGIPIDSGVNYRLTFDASASVARELQVLIQRPDSPWTTYAEKKIDLTAATQTVTLEFKMTYASNTNGQLAFNMGQSTGSVILSNVKFIRIAALSPTGIAADRRVASSSVKPTLRAAQSPSGVKVSFKASESGAATLRLYNLKGDVLSTVSLQTISGKNYTQTLNPAGGKLPGGFYMVGLQRNNGAAERMSVLVK
jgi:hypothetical protein